MIWLAQSRVQRIAGGGRGNHRFGARVVRSAQAASTPSSPEVDLDLYRVNIPAGSAWQCANTRYGRPQVERDASTGNLLLPGNLPPLDDHNVPPADSGGEYAGNIPGLSRQG
jgi:hypothetical protein